MPEAARIRQEEFNSLRPPVLLLCFFWGVAIGFAINFFRPVETDPRGEGQSPVAVQSRSGTEGETAKQPSERERRLAGTPAIAAIDPAPLPAANAKLSFENAVIEAPALVLTTEGGLTGKNAPVPKSSGGPAAAPGLTPAAPGQPLIPDLDP